MTDNNERIVKLKEQILLPLTDMEMINRKNLLRQLLFEEITKTKDKNDIEKCKEMDDLAQDIITLGTKIIQIETIENQRRLYEIIKENYQFRARRYFRDFLIAIEWNFADDMKFYAIRSIVFDEWIEWLQSLEDGRLRGLSISAPPRTGKTRTWNIFLYVVYVEASRKKLFFCITYSSNGKKSILRYINVSNR